jgi:hypothetical protein
MFLNPTDPTFLHSDSFLHFPTDFQQFLQLENFQLFDFQFFVFVCRIVGK